MHKLFFHIIVVPPRSEGYRYSLLVVLNRRQDNGGKLTSMLPQDYGKGTRKDSTCWFFILCYGVTPPSFIMLSLLSAKHLLHCFPFRSIKMKLRSVEISLHGPSNKDSLIEPSSSSRNRFPSSPCQVSRPCWHKPNPW
jgi:hypothetical protein